MAQYSVSGSEGSLAAGASADDESMDQFQILSLPGALHLDQRDGDPRQRSSKPRRRPEKIRTHRQRPALSFTPGGQIAAYPERPQSPAKNKEAVHSSQAMANLFLTASQLLSAKYNVVDSPTPREQAAGGKTQGRIKVSRAVRKNADRVKTAFELKYLWLERSMEMPDDMTQVLPGIDGVYNPLQTIRNRLTRVTLRHPPVQGMAFTLPCNAFSSHNTSKKKWKLLWAVEINEFIADIAWQRTNWRVIRGPDGKLRFVTSLPGDHSPMKRLSNKIYDKLHLDFSSEDELDSNMISLFTVQSKSKELLGRGLKENIKKKARRLYGLAQDLGSESEAEELQSSANSKSVESLSKIKFLHVSRVGTKEDASEHQLVNGLLPPTGHTVPGLSLNDGEIRPPAIVVDQTGTPSLASQSSMSRDDDLKLAVIDVPFSPAHMQLKLSNKIPISPAEKSTGKSLAGLKLDLNTNLVEAYRSNAYLKSVTVINNHYLQSVYPEIMTRVEAKVEGLSDQQLTQVLQLLSRVNTELLPARDELYRTLIDDTKEYIRMANDDYAARIDNLSTATDRAYGELNTSLLMDLRKTAEKIDSLSTRLFGARSTLSSLSQDTLGVSVPQRTYLHFLLENLIVVLLRLVWVVVNVLKVFYTIFYVFWKVGSIIYGLFR